MEIKPIHISQTEVTPAVNFDRRSLTLQIVGESYPEDTLPFFEQLGNWLYEYPFDDSPLKLILELYYINTSSSKALLDLIQFLDMKARTGAKIEADWRFLNEVFLMRDLGSELLEAVSFPWQVVPIEPDRRL